MSKQRTCKFVTKILRKTCSSLVKIIPDGENNFSQNKYNKLQKISAKISTPKLAAETPRASLKEQSLIKYKTRTVASDIVKLQKL